MILWGLDLATRTGSCIGRPADTPAVKAVKAPVTGEDYGEFGLFFYRFFYNMLDYVEMVREPNERVVVLYESPFIPREHWDPKLKKMVGGTTIATTRKLQSLGVLLETVCRLHIASPDVFEVDIKTIKKQLTGSGNADKAAMVAAARRAGISLSEGEESMDEADAFGAWLVALHHYAPQHQPAWDRRLFSGPGNLPL